MPVGPAGPAGPTTPPVSAITAALRSLAATNEAARREGPALAGWRWSMRQRVTAVRDLLV